MGINRNKVLTSARKQLRKRNWTKAIAKYEQLVDDDPSDVRSKLKTADLYAKIDRRKDALDAYQSVASHYADDDLFEKAVAVYKQALRMAPDQPQLHRKLGDAYHRLGRLKDAVRAYHEAQKRFKAAGDVAAQRDLLERMIRLDPDDVGMRIQLAERYAKDDLDQKAIELFEAALATLDAEGRIDEFIQVAERILYLDERAAELRRRVIDIYLRRGRNKQALKHLQVCFKHTPQDIDILELLADVFQQLDHLDKAVLVMHELAASYRDQGRSADATRTYRDILDVRPSDQRARSNLAELAPVDESGSMTGAPKTDSLGGSSGAAGAPADTGELDALAGIEFLDDDDDDDSYEVVEAHQSTQPPPAPGLSASNQSASDQSHRPSSPPPSRDGAAPTDHDQQAMVDISGDIQSIDPVEPTIEHHDDSEAVEAGIERALKETDVFIKYGLHDKAYEAIVGVIAKHPDSIAAHQQMKKLQQARHNPEGAVDELLELARITRTTPNRAQQFLDEAAGLTDDIDRIRAAAQSYGIDEMPADNPSTLDDISLVELDASDSADTDEPADVLDIDDLEFVDHETQADPTGLDDDQVDQIETSLDAMDQAGIDPAGVDLSEDTDPDLIDVDDDLGFDADDFDQADVVEVDVDDFGELSDDQMVDLDEQSAADAAETNDIGFDVSEEQADSMFDSLFGGDTGEDALFENSTGNAPASPPPVSPPPASNAPADQAPPDELAEVDFFLQQGLLNDARDALAAARRAAPNHPGIDRRHDQIEAASQRQAPPRPPAEKNPSKKDTSGQNVFGAQSLSQKFHPNPGPADADNAPSLEVDQAAFNNTSIELGSAYRDMGLYDEAIDEFKQALDDPEAANIATYHIAVCELEQGRTSPAAERLQQLVDQPDTPHDLRQAAQRKLRQVTA